MNKKKLIMQDNYVRCLNYTYVRLPPSQAYMARIILIVREFLEVSSLLFLF